MEVTTEHKSMEEIKRIERYSKEAMEPPCKDLAGGTGLSSSRQSFSDRRFENDALDEIQPVCDYLSLSVTPPTSIINQPPTSSTAATIEASDISTAAFASPGAYGCQYCHRTGTLDQSLLSGPFHAPQCPRYSPGDEAHDAAAAAAIAAADAAAAAAALKVADDADAAALAADAAAAAALSARLDSESRRPSCGWLFGCFRAPKTL
jgi:hypothetical protein